MGNVVIKPEEQGLNFLIAGKHDNLVDTLMYAHIDVSREQVTLISIPRDLYVNNRKINAVYHSFGMNELKLQLSSITGYPIDKYILIDMYAFIDVIDILGGVDVTLDSEVIDPSYKVYDEGKWGTLYYKPGTYHLNGRQALRLARTRHYSSDFERAKRQQTILDALKTKALGLGVGDADKILSSIQVVLSKTETDITPQEAISYFFRYRNFQVRKGYVLSTANVLSSKRQNDIEVIQKTKECSIMIEGEEKQQCLDVLQKMDKGAYILEPENGNWQLIKWFFKKTFEE